MPGREIPNEPGLGPEIIETLEEIMRNRASLRYRWLTALLLCAVVHLGIPGPTGAHIVKAASSRQQPHARFAYAINRASRDITMYRINPATGYLSAIGTVAAGGEPVDVVSIPGDAPNHLDVRPVYLANQSSNTVAVFIADPNTGLLRLRGSVRAGLNPRALAIDPMGQFLLAANETSDDISVFRINRATGGLEPAATIPAGDHPVAVEFHPSGTMAYALNFGSGTISTYLVDRGQGTLFPVPFAIPAGEGPTSLAILPNGAGAVVTNPSTHQVSLFLIPFQPIPIMVPLPQISTSGDPTSVTVDRNGFVMITIAGLNVIAIFKLIPSGGLEYRGVIPAGIGPSDIAIDSNGFIYVANRESNDVSMYAIGTGWPWTQLGRVSAGVSPQCISLMF